ncbi:MAG: hypothetical protein ACKOFI_00315, partial [Phycisphaerales bacterium]
YYRGVEQAVLSRFPIRSHATYVQEDLSDMDAARGALPLALPLPASFPPSPSFGDAGAAGAFGAAGALGAAGAFGGAGGAGGADCTATIAAPRSAAGTRATCAGSIARV